MSSSATKWMGSGLVLVAALTATAGAAGVGRERTAIPSSGPPSIDSDTEIRIRALADAATLGVSGIGCDGLLRGSGFVVGDATYTNRHLVEGGEAVKFDQLLDPVVLALDSVATDLDVATTAGVDVPSLDFADRNPSIGDIVFVAGHAAGGDTEVLKAKVQSYGEGSTWGVGGNVMLIDVVTVPGFSGGPVLDVDGRVVAMLEGVEPTIGLTLAIPVEDLRSWSALGQEATPARCQR